MEGMREELRVGAVAKQREQQQHPLVPKHHSCKTQAKSLVHGKCLQVGVVGSGRMERQWRE